jgi:hypothetical protein
MRKLILQDLTSKLFGHRRFPKWAQVTCLLATVAVSSATISVFATAGELPEERLAKAEAIFQERCKTAGVRIYRIVENVEGIFLMKLRPNTPNLGNQFDLDDPYGSDLGGDGYIVSFLRGSFQANTTGTPAPGSPSRIGYAYVEVVESVERKRYRYTGSIKDVDVKSSMLMGADGKRTFMARKYVLDKIPVSGHAPRFGVTYDDISTREDRNYWIAGSSLKVMDLKTNEVIAERIGYMLDRGQGNTAHGRAPWLLAADHACPSFQRNPQRPLPPGQGAAAQSRQTQDFVEKVLKPKQEK